MPVVLSSLSDLKFAHTGNPLDFNEKYYKRVISNYRKRKLKEVIFSLTELNLLKEYFFRVMLRLMEYPVETRNQGARHSQNLHQQRGRR